MPLINTSLPNLIQGVSQQPDSVRFDGQCEEQENALSSVVDGLVKRPNTRHIARLLEEAIDENSFVHFINRDVNEKYVLIHDGEYIRAFNLSDGTEATINGAVGGYEVSGGYLDSTTPRTDLKALTVADNTFLLNTDKTVTKDTQTLTPEVSDYALCTVMQGNYNTFYRVEAVGTFQSAQVSVVITPEGTQYRHTFTLENAGVSYGLNEDGTPQISPADIKIFPKGYSSSHPDAINGVIDDNPASPSYTTIASVTASVLLDAEYPEWESEKPIFRQNLGKLETLTGIASSGTITHADTSVIAGNLKTCNNKQNITLNEQTAFNANFTVEQQGCVLLIQPNGTINREGTSGGTFTASLESISFTTVDGLGNDGLSLAYKRADAITDLPKESQHGFKVKVTGDVELNEDDYYVEFEADDNNGFGVGSYVEVSGSGIEQQINSDTFIHRVISTGVNQFSLKALRPSPRRAGDDSSNPFNSFVGEKINNIFFFKNRLGLLSKENVILSESGNVFNFFRTSVRSLLDSDPIDVSVASRKVSNLKAAVGFQENLILFSNSGQFTLKGGDLLTPKTVAVTPITNFTFEDGVEPINLGSYIYFPFTRGSFTGVYQFATDASSDTYTAVEITEHVPRYIPKAIQKTAATSSEDCLVLLSGDEPNTLYVYKYFFNGSEKVLSAWSKFTFESDIRGMEFIDSSLFVVSVLNDETNLVELPLESGLKDPVGYTTYLDQRIEDTVLNGDDVITLPYTPAPEDTIEVYTKDGLKLSSTRVGSTVTLTQAVSEDTDVWVGYPYTMKYTFSELIFKASAGNSKSPSNAAKLKVRNGSVFYNDSAFFKVSVTPLYRDTYENVFTPNVVGSTTLGELNLSSGAYRFPVFSKAEDTKITITNDSALPSNFTSAEFESFTHSRSQRYAG